MLNILVKTLNISQNPQKNTDARVFFLTKLQGTCNFIKKETLAPVFSCEFCEIFKNKNLHLLLLLLLMVSIQTSKNILSRMFYKIGVLKNFAKFTGKRAYRGLFLNKAAVFQPTTWLKNGMNKYSCSLERIR